MTALGEHALTGTSTGGVANCIPDDHKCQPTDCIPLSVTGKQLPCVPEMNCNPGSQWPCAPKNQPAAQANSIAAEAYVPNETCYPESSGDLRRSVAALEACTPDFWGCEPVQCSPKDKAPTRVATRFLWLDLTRKCQLECLHCYNSSGPDGNHGTMTRNDWFSVLDQAIRTGIEMIQLIGGEPTMHPDFAELVNHGLTIGLKVEVFSNLVHIKPEWWELFQRPGMSLATSYYSDDATEHDGITRRDSHRKTRANIARAVDLGIPLRTGVIAVNPGQRTGEAVIDLTAIGVKSVGTDRVRHFGRGQQEHACGDVSELCGHCGDGRAAIGPDGTVTPCIMSSWLKVGNVKTASLPDILAGKQMARAIATIPKLLKADPCTPGAECQPDAHPCYPKNEG
jgi:MoaA/NifB/PqqE/SkfB family radical SAM enzyme